MRPEINTKSTRPSRIERARAVEEWIAECPQVRSSSHAKPGVDREGHACDPRGLVRDEGGDGVEDILRLEDVDGHGVLHRQN